MAIRVRIGQGKVEATVEHDLALYAGILDGVLALHVTAPTKVPFFKSVPLELREIERRDRELNSVLVCFGAQNQWELRAWNRTMLAMSPQSVLQVLKNRHAVVYQFDEPQPGQPPRKRTVIVIPATKGCYAIVAEAHPKTDIE